jgi:hypothetical protein
MWPRGKNKFSRVGNTITWISRNPYAKDGPLNAAWKFETDLTTCKVKVTRDLDGDGTFEFTDYTGDPSGWPFWPDGI